MYAGVPATSLCTLILSKSCSPGAVWTNPKSTTFKTSGMPPIGEASRFPAMGTVYANDTSVGNDSTFSGNPLSLTSANTPVLLAALTLNATITSPGDSYSIKLVPSSGNGSMNTGGQTFFDVVDFASTGLETSAVPFTSTSGTVLIGRASTPELASLVSGLVGKIAIAGFYGVRRLQRIKRLSI